MFVRYNAIINTVKTWSAILIVALASAAVFLPGVGHEFVGWDDNVMVFDNPLIKKLDLDSAAEIFSRFYYAPYVPLVILSYALEHHFFDLDAVYYHLSNIFLHAVNAVLVLALLRRLGASLLAAFIAALLFGLHPLRVESVVWITERKDVLSGLFFLLALLSYLRRLGLVRPSPDGSRDEGGRGDVTQQSALSRALWYGLALLLFLCSLLSKPTVAPFPLVLLLVDWLRGRRISVRSIAEKAPFFLLAAAFSVVAVIVQYSPGADHSTVRAAWSDPLIGLTNIVFYLGKTLFPVNLSAFYSYPRPLFDHLPGLLLLLCLLAALTALIIRSLRNTRSLAAAAGFYLIMLLPVLKLIPFGEEFARADRYTYLPSIGLGALVGLGIDLAWRSRGRGARRLLIVAGTLGALSLAALSAARSTIWTDTIVLFTDVLKKHPNVAVAYANMGTAYGHRGEYEKELACYRKYLELRPQRRAIHQNIAVAYQQMGDRDSLRGDYEAANKYYGKEAESYRILIGDQGESPRLYNLLGVALGRSGKYREAVESLERAVILKPDDPDVYNNLGLALGYLGYLDQAREAFETSIRLDPTALEPRANLTELLRSIRAGSPKNQQTIE
jgi:tetratricopeptide (TPR) repeat protein